MPRGFQLSLRQRLENELRRRQEEEQKKGQPSVGVRDVAREIPGAAVKVGKAIGNFFTSNTQKFGNTIGSTLALPEQQAMLEEEERQNYEQQQKILEQIRRNKMDGRDSTRLMQMYRDMAGGLPDIEELNPVINKTNKQVLGEAAGTLLEATAAAKFSKAAQTGRILRPGTPTVIASGAKAVTRAAAAKAAAKGVAVGAGQGYLYDVAKDLQDNKSVKDIIKPGIGTALGAGISGAIGLYGITRTEAALQIDDLVGKGFSKKEAEKIVNEGGYMRLFENPRMRELGDKINELNARMVNATGKAEYNRYKKAYDLAMDAYKKESQAGFIKLPGFGADDVPDFPDGLTPPPGGVKKGSLADEAAQLDKARGVASRPAHQLQIEEALNNNDVVKAQKIVDKLDDSDPYKKSMQAFLKTGTAQEGRSAAQTAQILAQQAGQKPPVQPPIPKDVSSFYNVNRLKINDKAKEAINDEIQKAGDELQATVGKKLSNKEVLDLAKNTEDVLNTTVTREETAAKIASNLKLRQEIARAASTGKVDKNFIDLWIKDKSVGEDIARQLQARKIEADPAASKAIDAILGSIYKVNKNADDIAKAAEGVDFNDPKQVTEFYRKFIQPNASEWIDALRYNSMLSSPTTHLVNASSNFQGTGLLAPIEKTITGTIDATRAALTGGKRNYAVGEGAAYAKGYYSNIGTAFKRFTQVMKNTKTFNYNPDLPPESQIGLASGGIKGGIEKTLKFPTRLLEATDQFFSAMTEGGVESSLAYRASKGIGSQDDVAQEVAKRLFRGELHSAEQGYVLNSIDDVTGLISRARHSDNPVTSNIAKFTLPFLRTPMNLFKQGIEYSPLGVTTLVGAQNKTQQLSKIIIGTASAAGAATLLGQDRLTWAEPTNAKQKAAFRAAGRQAYSIKIGNKWVSYSKLHPALAFNFALVAAIDDAKKNARLDDSEADSILSAFGKYGNFIADQSYLKNIGDFVGAVKGEGGGFSKLVSNYPSQLIPFRAMMSYVERIVDPSQRQVDPDGTLLEKQMQNITAQIPWVAEQNITVGGKRLTPIPRQGPLGQPIDNNMRYWNAISPARLSEEDPTYEGIYQVQQAKLRLDRMKADIKDRLQSEIKKRMLQSR